jgi:phage-related protein
MEYNGVTYGGDYRHDRMRIALLKQKAMQINYNKCMKDLWWV